MQLSPYPVSSPMESAESSPGMQKVSAAMGFRALTPLRRWRLAVAGHRQRTPGGQQKTSAGRYFNTYFCAWLRPRDTPV